MTSSFFHGLRRAAKAAGAAGLACVLVAGCGGGGGGASASLAAGTPAASTATGDGAKTAEVPIVALPAAGDCAAAGIDAKASPLLNSKLDCAP